MRTDFSSGAEEVILRRKTVVRTKSASGLCRRRRILVMSADIVYRYWLTWLYSVFCFYLQGEWYNDEFAFIC